MAMSSDFKTSKGTTLPITNLKGKPYLMVAHRIFWFREENPTGFIETQVLQHTNDYSVVHSTVGIVDKEGRKLILGTGSKREDKGHFMDHLEKAETGATGRALALAGYGTQFTGDELEEGQRLADSPVTPARKETVEKKEEPKIETKPSVAKAPAFKKPGKKETSTNETTTTNVSGSPIKSDSAGSDDGWS
jgi:hypothetical protein